MSTHTQTQTHTPGPWHRGATAGNGRNSIFSNEGRMRLEKGGTALYPIANLVGGWDEDEANAALIASAPDLLAALRGLWNIATHPKATKADIRMIARECEAAIAKAEGGAA
jgi:hypothetical protein